MAALFLLLEVLFTVASGASQPTRTSSFAYNAHAPSTLNRYPTPLPKARYHNGTYGPAFNRVSHLLPLNATTTTFSLDRDATGEGEYGPSAFAALWKGRSYSNTVPFTTTPAATPVPSSELAFPPPLYQACSQDNSCLENYYLPKSFMWGVASSAWQYEGGMLSEGRGPSGLDAVGALPFREGTAAIPSVTNDSVISAMGYFLYKQDIARLAAIGVPYYSFSISWTRVVPFGTVGSPINQQALDHYDDVIDTCLQYGVTPIVTLWHFDAPLLIGPKSPEFPDAFLYYAKQVLARYASKVPVWQTLNEPNLSFVFGTKYVNNMNMLKAHASVYHWYKNVLKGTGRMSLKFSNNIAIPLTNSTEDRRAALRYQNSTSEF